MTVPPSTRFVDRSDWTYNVGAILAEAIPIAMLMGLFLLVAIVPLSVVFLFGGGSPLGTVLTAVAQFVLAVGGGVVLLHIVVRGIELADEDGAA